MVIINPSTGEVMVGVFLFSGVWDGSGIGVSVWLAGDGVSWVNEGDGVGRACVVSWSNNEGNVVGETCVRSGAIAALQAQSVTPMTKNWKERNIVSVFIVVLSGLSVGSPSH